MEYLDAYACCELCPNLCRVNRLQGEVGRCGERDVVRVAWSGLHRGEEPPVTGENGSGMIFFCGCPLHCAYCQNHQISGGLYGGDMSVGLEFTTSELATLMLSLQDLGATNLNLVTGTHFIPSIIIALEDARKRGFSLQVVWNSSGYESPFGLQLIDPYVDLYLVDLKTMDKRVSKAFCGLEAYADSIEEVMLYLRNTHPRTYTDEEGNLKGLLVRHLLFPGTFDATEEVLRYYASHLKKNAFLSLMVQFIPPKGMAAFPEVSETEYERLLELLEELEIEDGFIQELGDNISWIPDFTQEIPFPAGFATPLPYFLEKKRSSPR